MLKWLPGAGGTNSPAGSISNRRISGDRSRTSRSRPLRHSMASGTARLLGGNARGARALSLLVRQQTVDHTTSPQCAGIDVEIIKRHAGIFVDGPLLCL